MPSAYLLSLDSKSQRGGGKKNALREIDDMTKSWEGPSLSVFGSVCASPDGSWSLGAIFGRESGRLCVRMGSKVKVNPN
jgi:hypothetical protein